MKRKKKDFLIELKALNLAKKSFRCYSLKDLINCSCNEILYSFAFTKILIVKVESFFSIFA